MTKVALVAGGGIAGTVTALALLRAGYQPRVFESHPDDADERGAFVTVAVNGLEALRALHLDPTHLLANGFATPRMALRTAKGKLLAELPLGGPLADGVSTTTIRRADLYTALRQAAEQQGITIAYGKKLTGITKRAQGVTAEFADGDTADGELLVGADGLHSRTRKVLDPTAPGPRYLGLLNAGGFAPTATDRPEPGVMQMAFGTRAFFGWASAPDGSVWWFANPPAEQPVRPGDWTPESWRAHLIDLFRKDDLPAADLIAASAEVVGPWSTWDFPRVKVWHDDRIVLVGDAAHAVSPSSGQGASMAIEDAVTLGQCLAGGTAIPEAFLRYERLRRTRVEKVVAYGRRSGSTKLAGPAGAAIRDAIMPLAMRMLYRNGNPQAWILDQRFEPI